MDIVRSINPARIIGVVARRDAALFDLICARRTAALNRVMIPATRSGDGATYLVLAVLGLALGGPGGRALLGIAATAGLASAIAWIPKRLVARPRPTSACPLRVALVEPPDAWSFPSAHTATVVAAACAIGAAFGPVAGALAVGWAVLVGISRVYVGAHYPLDVVIGALLGAAVWVAVSGVLTNALLSPLSPAGF